MGYSVYGTDLSEKMIDYSHRNLTWLSGRYSDLEKSQKPQLEVGDATKHQWKPTPDFIASEIYLGQPMSKPPVEIKFRAEKENSEALLTSFLKNLAPQIASGTQIALAIPAWLRPNGKYSGLDILDRLDSLGYNLTKYRYASFSDLLYYREGQIVARQIIVLRKK
jgi:tRNA G10  N-methylase Trm11